MKLPEKLTLYAVESGLPLDVTAELVRRYNVHSELVEALRIALEAEQGNWPTEGIKAAWETLAKHAQ